MPTYTLRVKLTTDRPITKVAAHDALDAAAQTAAGKTITGRDKQAATVTKIAVTRDVDGE